MRTRSSPTIALLAFVLLTSSCASAPPLEGARPPRLQMPSLAAEPCAVYLLPDLANIADLEVGYETRGAQVKACDAWRALAVETFEAEHRIQEDWLAQREARNRPWWRLSRRRSDVSVEPRP